MEDRFITVPIGSIFITPMTQELMFDKRFIGILDTVKGEQAVIKVFGSTADLSKACFLKDELREFRDMWE